jgi:glycine/D-amino acid oxidase-like deaminating enzyme
MVYPRLEDGKPFALLQQGENSTTVAGVLEQLGVGTETFLKTIDVDAGYRMLWDSILWLVCHAPLGDDDSPLTIGQAHDKRQDAIDRLWAELLPALVRFLGKGDWVGKKSSSELRIVEKSLQQMANQWVGKDPSSEIRNFVPGKEESLALFETRNGRFLKLATKENPQTFHRELLQKVTDFETMEEIPYFERLVETWRRSVPERAKLDLESIHLAVWGTRDAERAKDPPPKHITIVGGGILGCAMALSLAQTKDPETTIVVLDKALSEEGVGATTPASWAWINANSKHPKSYRDLNRLGIHAWKHEPHLSPLPSWTGSLVRFEEYPDFCDDGDYPAVGPLSAEDVRSLEPFCDWSPVGNNTEGHTFLFSDEGNVDPSAAVRALRKAAKSLGVEFVSGHNVTALVRDPETNKLSGVLCQKLRVDGAGASSFGEDEFIATDLLVSAAGTGVAATCLGGVPLLHRPGQIAYARPTKKKGFRLEATTTVGLRSGISFDTNTLDYEKMRLCLILVDQLRSSHLLQRRDGTLVAGGGALEVGGTSGTIPIGSASESASLLEGARQLSPLLIETATLDKVVSAVRPMPSDGLPVVGFVEQGLYVAVTHSGITLGPLLAALAAGEILQHVDCDLLAPYRPSRFSRDD